MNQDIERIIYTKDEIANAVKSLGKRISGDYSEKTPVLLCVLKGSVIFFSDLVRAIELPVEIDFITAKSYGMSAKSSGKIEILYEPSCNIENRDVILVEDIVDTAETLTQLVNTLKNKKPASLKTAAFLDKQIPRKVEFSADYKCFDVENEFVVGYGLDYAQRYRNLPYVGVLKREIYM